MTRRRFPRRGPLFRRPSSPRLRGGPRRPPLPPRIRRALARAHHLMADERFTEAAEIFDRLSTIAYSRKMFVRAADLTLQAARADLAADDAAQSLERTRKALRLFMRGERAERIPRVVSRIAEAFRERGYTHQADQLEREAAQMLEAQGLSWEDMQRREPSIPEQRGSLPAQCEGCGASLRPDEVEWHDAETAECLYCGALVKTS